MAKKKPAEKATKTESHAKFLKAVGALATSQLDTDGQLGQDFSAAIDAVDDSIPKTDMGIDGMRLHVETMAFLVEAEKYDNRMDLDMTADITDPPHDDFWRTLGAVAEEYGKYGNPPKSAQPPETVKMLADSGVHHDQIARMWGFVKDGAAQVDLVQKELAEPGSVLNKTFIHPDDAKRDVKRKDEHAKYVKLLDQQNVEPEAPKPCPETAEELYRQAVSEEQTARMLVLPVEKVQELWAGFKQKGIKQQGIPTTSRDGQPLTDWIATTSTAAPEAFAPPNAATFDGMDPTFVETAADQPNSIYEQSSDTDLSELCEVAGISTAGKYRSEMIEALEEADKQGTEVGQ